MAPVTTSLPTHLSQTHQSQRVGCPNSPYVKRPLVKRQTIFVTNIWKICRYLENLVYHFFRQLWLVLGVKLMEINSKLFSRYLAILRGSDGYPPVNDHIAIAGMTSPFSIGNTSTQSGAPIFQLAMLVDPRV